ncbi:MAG: magnesium transporter [Thermoanaerobaculia bacterium]
MENQEDGKGPAGAEDIDALAAQVVTSGPREAAELLRDIPVDVVSETLRRINPSFVQDVLEHLSEKQRDEVIENAEAAGEQWERNLTYPEDTIGRLMEPPVAVFTRMQSISEATERVRELVKKVFVTYCFVVDAQGKLVGVVTMRDLLLAPNDELLENVMLRNPFFLTPETGLMEAMKRVLNRHYPVYPICDETGKLIGQVRGQTMFEEQAYEISAQAGEMVGVDKEERLTTPWARSLKFRHPWLQLNLLTAFIAAAVVGFFQDTIDRIVILAVFLPVLAGQSGNTGCQALAVALRGMTLGELRAGRERALVMKESFLGLLNGALVGVSAGVAMFFVARAQGNPNALTLGAIVFFAMICSCVISGLSGAMIPLTLRKLGADPATASSIFLTTATDVASMGIFLSLATLLIPK